MKVVCAECMKMCYLGGKNSVVKGLKWPAGHERCHGNVGPTRQDGLFYACQEQEVREQNVSCRGYAIQVQDYR